MFPLYEISSETHELNNKARESLRAVHEQMNTKGDQIELSSGENLSTPPNVHSKYLYIVEEGFLKFSIGKKLLLFLEAGDLVGFGNLFDIPDSKIYTDLATKLIRYPREEFLQEIASSSELAQPWNRYLECSFSLMVSLIARLTPEELNIELDTDFFWPGEAIIIQETEPKRVFTLLNGTAEVYLGDNRVGEVLTGEIFGAMAATANSRTSASVIAKTPCLVMSLPKENFLTLATTHPETLFKLVEDMSRIILSQNERIVHIEQQAKNS